MIYSGLIASRLSTHSQTASSKISEYSKKTLLMMTLDSQAMRASKVQDIHRYIFESALFYHELPPYHSSDHLNSSQNMSTLDLAVFIFYPSIYTPLPHRIMVSLHFHHHPSQALCTFLI